MLFDETANEIKYADRKVSDNDHRDENGGDDEPDVGNAAVVDVVDDDVELLFV